MKRMLVCLVVASLSVGGTAHGMTRRVAAAPGEGCAAMNPAAPTCTFTVTSPTEQQGGAVGTGTWQVTIKRGKKTYKLNSATTYGEPSEASFSYETGDKVTVSALTPGAGVLAGTVY